jgi:hypothetical protein
LPAPRYGPFTITALSSTKVGEPPGIGRAAPLKPVAPQRSAPFVIGWNGSEAPVALSSRLRYAIIRTTLGAPPSYAGLLVLIFILAEHGIPRMVESPVI